MSFGYYVICIEPYEIDGVFFDLGYIEKYTSTRPLVNDVNWRRATNKEIEDFFKANSNKTPKGRYAKNDYTS